MGYPTNCFQERTWKAQQCLPGLKLPWLRSNRVRFVVPTSSGLAQLREPGRSESDFCVWTWGDTKWKIMIHHFFFLNIAIHYEHGGIPLGYHGGIPWGYHIFRKKPLVTLQVGVALMLFSDGQMVNVSQPLATKTPWSPKFDTVDGTLGALPPMLGENMDDINRDMGDTVWDTGW